MKTLRILHIDNETEFAFFLKANLEAAGAYEVQSVHDGYNGLIQAEKVQPDLILLDLLMPAMNGFDVLEKLKANPATQGIPVIIVSAVNDRSSIEESLRRGAVSYLVKPFLTQDLVRAIAGVVKHA